jgi:hypothetical protein
MAEFPTGAQEAVAQRFGAVLPEYYQRIPDAVQRYGSAEYTFRPIGLQGQDKQTLVIRIEPDGNIWDLIAS